ncbi:MAG: MASE1 domain-containing protein [Hyphomicrobiaceae bacterium]
MNPAVVAFRPAAVHLSACYIAYLLAAAFGQWMMVVPGISITVWPPNGVVLAVLLANDRRSWMWWIATAALGELTANLIWFSNPLLPALGYVSANAIEVVLAARLLAPLFTPPEVRFNTLRQLLAFLVIGVLASPAIGATIGSAIDAAIGKKAFVVTWPLWWLGDATGILVATPLVITAINAWRMLAKYPVAPRPAQVAEAGAIAVVLAGLGYWLASRGLAYAFVLFVPILWAALRFEMRGATLATLMVALIIGLHAQEGEPRPVVNDGAAYRHAMLQLLILVAAATGLIVAVIVRQYRHALGDLAVTNSQLERRVAQRTREIRAAEQRFKATFENAAVGMSILDAAGTILRVNESLADLLGYSSVELENRPLDAFTHPDDLAASHQAWDRLKSGSEDSYIIEKRYVRKDGEVIWGHTSVSCVREPGGEIDYLIKVIQDISARRRSDEARQLLMHELNHRSKNMLAIIDAIARQTAARTPDAFVETFGQRLQALAASQDLLVKSGWEPVRLDELVRAQLAHFDALVDERFDISGPAVLVTARVAQAIGMALHELATNAAKYGSLSNDIGRVEIAWRVEGGNMFAMSWRETGGPKIAPPSRRGFGTTVVDAMVRSSLEGDVEIAFKPTGLEWRLRVPLAHLSEEVENSGARQRA